jgi:hypothetical protein
LRSGSPSPTSPPASATPARRFTLSLYAHLWNEAADDELATAALEAALRGKPMENGGGERGRTSDPGEQANVAFLHGSATGGD